MPEDNKDNENGPDEAHEEFDFSALIEGSFPLQPRIPEDTFRAIWTAAGAALFVAGIVIGMGWIGTSTVLPKGWQVTVASPILYVAGGLMVLGVYVFVAAYNDSTRWWLPGKKAVLASRSVRAAVALKRKGVAMLLTRARTRGTTLEFDPSTTVAQVTEWMENVADMITSLFSIHEAELFASSARRRDIRQGDVHSLLEPAIRSLRDLAVRLPSLEVTQRALNMDSDEFTEWLGKFENHEEEEPDGSEA